jgi:hypothetical protein
MIKDIVGILNWELYYQYQASFSSERGKEKMFRAKKKKTSLISQTLSTAFMSILVGIILSLIVVLPSIFSSGDQAIPVDTYMYTITQTMIIAVFFWSFLWIMDQSWLFQEHRLLEPLLPLPIPLRTLQRTLLSMFLIDVCGLILPFIALGIVKMRPVLCLGYFGATVLISMGVGLLCGSVIATRGTGSAAKRMASTVLMLLLIAGMVLIYQIGSFIEYLIGPLSVTFPGVDWVYPLSFGRGLFSGSPVSLAPMLLYLSLGIALYRWSFRRYWSRLTDQVYEHRKTGAVRYRVTSPFSGMLYKDIKLLGREPRLIYSMFYLPIFIIIFYFITPEVYGSWISLALIGLLSGIFSYSLIQIDEKHTPLLSSLPLKYLDKLLPKALFSIVPMSCTFAIISVLSFSLRSFIVPSLLAFSSALICLNIIMMATPKTATAFSRRTIVWALLGWFVLMAMCFFAAAFLLPFSYSPEIGCLLVLGIASMQCARGAKKAQK